jgi:hypothetical protein
LKGVSAAPTFSDYVFERLRVDIVSGSGGGGSQTLVVALFYNKFAGGVRPVYSIDAMAVIYMVMKMLLVALRFVRPTQMVSSAILACLRTTGDCMMPWLLITAPSARDQAALTRAVATAPQSNGMSSLPSSTRS